MKDVAADGNRAGDHRAPSTQDELKERLAVWAGIQSQEIRRRRLGGSPEQLSSISDIH